MSPEQYVETGAHLPPVLKDFHDAKLFFKWLVWHILAKNKGGGAIDRLDFATAQIFTIDYFLWFMAKFGYKLQRIRKTNVAFYDLDKTMAEYESQLREESAQVLGDALAEMRKGA